MNIFLQQNIKHSLYCLLVLSLACNSEKKLIGTYGSHAGTGVTVLRILPDKTFYYGATDEGPLFYSEGDWKKEGNYLMLHFFQEKRPTRGLIVQEKKINHDSITIKVTADKKVLAFASVACITKTGMKGFQSDINGEVHLKKTTVDSIYIFFIGKERAEYKVQDENSNSFTFNLAPDKGQYKDDFKRAYPDNTLKLLIVDDKLFTDEAYKDTANWNNWYGMNHFEKAKE